MITAWIIVPEFVVYFFAFIGFWCFLAFVTLLLYLKFHRGFFWYDGTPVTLEDDENELD